jgi:hypothetical protein
MLTCKLQIIVGNSSFVLDNHIQLDLYSTISLKQQSSVDMSYTKHHTEKTSHCSYSLMLHA